MNPQYRVAVDVRRPKGDVPLIEKDISRMAAPKTESPRSASFTWTAFLVMCFAVVGLVGVFGTFAAGLPMRRELAREATLDEAVQALSGPNPQTVLESLRPRLDDSAPALFPLPADPDAAIAAERLAMRARFLAEAEAITARMQMMIL